jgi:(E)-4-hydroxy-3-methylbut-2-enyl-diphosphate synthase
MGCRILRFAVPNLEAADTLGELSRRTAMPLVADIHFDYRIALRCLDYPIAKIRINPGNIGSREKAKAVMDLAAERGRPIRIGINAGSLPKDLAQEVDDGAMTRAEALVASAERELAWCDGEGFKDVLLSMKASDIVETLAANRLIAGKRPIPLHLGVTEAGPLIPGIVRNAVAMTTLLLEGIGSTIRVSLSDTMESEVMAAREILAAVTELRGESAAGKGVTIVSCPRCGRNSFDTHAFAQRWQERLYAMDKDITVAFMGCAVNGPGEARHADLGITGMGDKVLIFAHGEIVRTVNGSEADRAFKEELAKL